MFSSLNDFKTEHGGVSSDTPKALDIIAQGITLGTLKFMEKNALHAMGGISYFRAVDVPGWKLYASIPQITSQGGRQFKASAS